MIKLITLDTNDVSITENGKNNSEDIKHITEDKKESCNPLIYDRKNIQQSFRLDLTKSRSAWIKVAKLPEELCTYAQSNFDTLFNLHPVERGKVIMSHEYIHNEIESTRWQASYLNTPKWDQLMETSYMFSGVEISQIPKKVVLPQEFRNFSDYMNQIGKYNQVVANWYKDGNDFIAYHSDYSYGMPKDTDVAILSLHNHPDDFRVFSIKAKQNETFDDALFERIDIKVRHGCVLFMCGDTQYKFRHGLSKMDTQSRSLSLTFRYYD